MIAAIGNGSRPLPSSHGLSSPAAAEEAAGLAGDEGLAFGFALRAELGAVGLIIE
jgi:hypothetical protein